MLLKATIVFQKNWDAINEPCKVCLTGVSGCSHCEGSGKHYRYIVNEGSSRSSKTISLIDVVHLYAEENQGKRITIWRDTKIDCKQTVLVDMKKHLLNTGRSGEDRLFIFNETESVYKYINGATVEIHGTDDDIKVHGLTQDLAWLNEPYKISEETFDQIDQRTSDFVFLDWNPKKKHWIDKLKNNPRTLLIKSTFRDNAFCPPEQRKKILSYQPLNMCEAVTEEIVTIKDCLDGKVDPEALYLESVLSKKQKNELIRCISNEIIGTANAFNWSVYGLGEKAEKPNKIYNWKKIPYHKYHEIKNVPIALGNDWGVVDPWGIVEVKLYDGALYVHQLNYKSENKLRDENSKYAILSVEDEGLVKKKFLELNIPEDRVVICDNNRPKKILALRNIGYEYAVACIKGSIVDGISLLQDMKVYFTDTSSDLEDELEEYSWKVDRYGIQLEEAIDEFNHLLDAVRYVAEYFRTEGLIKKA